MMLGREEIEDGNEKKKRHKTTLTTSLRCRKGDLSALCISAERYGLELLEWLDKVLDRLEATSGFFVN